MITLSAKTRQVTGRKVSRLREQGILPAVLYGSKVGNLALSVDLKEFEKIYEEAGESSIVKLKVEKEKAKIEEVLVLIKEVTRDPLTEKFLHVDFYQPKLEEKAEVTIPLVFEGESLAVKELDGVLIKSISEIEVKALPQNLPKEIRVDVSILNTFDDTFKIRDLKIPPEVEVLREPEEVIALVAPPVKEEIEEKPVKEALVEEEKAAEEEKKVEQVKEKPS